MNFEERLAENAQRAKETEAFRLRVERIAVRFNHERSFAAVKGPEFCSIDSDKAYQLALDEAKFLSLCSPERMLLVAEILRTVRTYDLAADVAGLLKKLDEVET